MTSRFDESSWGSPEPAPQNKGTPVAEELIKWLKKRPESSGAVALVRRRVAFGAKKYGQPLMSQDGRNSVRDAMEELGDLMQYLYKAAMNGDDTSPIKSIIPHLNAIVDLSSERKINRS